MLYKYFFDQDTLFHGNVGTSVYTHNKNIIDDEPVIEVAHGKNPLEAVRQLFQIDFSNIVSLKRVVDIRMTNFS